VQPVLLDRLARAQDEERLAHSEAEAGEGLTAHADLEPAEQADAEGQASSI
jgi:hypothetical protein